MAEIQVNLVAVERELWGGKAQMVVARTVDGDIGVMAGHSPLLAQLREGFAARIIETNGNVLGVAVHGGFLSVTKDGVSILAEDAQLSDEIDVTKARAAYEAAKSQRRRFCGCGGRAASRTGPVARHRQRHLSLQRIPVASRWISCRWPRGSAWRYFLSSYSRSW